MRCRPGDLAVIVRSDIDGNLGRLVEVIGPVPIDVPGEPAWVVRSHGAPLFTACNDSRMVAWARDSWLRPLRPDADPVETETEREVVA